MKQLHEICFNHIFFSQENLKSFFSSLRHIYFLKTLSHYDSHAIKSMPEELLSISKDEALLALELSFTRMDNKHRLMALNTLLPRFFSTENVELLNSQHELFVRLLKLVKYDIELTTKSPSANEVLTSSLESRNLSVFNELLKCSFDINKLDKDPEQVTAHSKGTTIFSLIVKKVASSSPTDFEVKVAHIMLSKSYERKVDTNSAAIAALFKSIEGANLCAKHNLKYEDFIEHLEYKYESLYPKNTIQDIYKGICIEFNANKQDGKSISSLDGYNKTAYDRYIKLKEMISSKELLEADVIATFTNPESVFAVITEICKEENKNNYSRKGRTYGAMSALLSLFEEITGKETLICNDVTRITPELFKLSKANYSGDIIRHTMEKFTSERLAKHVTGVEQAKYLMEELKIDPVTMLSLVEKESVQRQLMGSISGL
jgi:hypothetical protein